MKLKMTNGNKPSWLAYLSAAGIIVMLIFTFTRLSDRIFAKGTNTAILTQEVEDVGARIGTVEFDIKENTRVDAVQTTDIKVLETQFNNIDKKLDEILRKL